MERPDPAPVQLREQHAAEKPDRQEQDQEPDQGCLRREEDEVDFDLVAVLDDERDQPGNDQNERDQNRVQPRLPIIERPIRPPKKTHLVSLKRFREPRPKAAGAGLSPAGGQLGRGERPSYTDSRRLPSRLNHDHARKEGAHGGTRGSHVHASVSDASEPGGSPVIASPASAAYAACWVKRGNEAGLMRGRERSASHRAIGRAGGLGEGAQTRLFEVAKFAGLSLFFLLAVLFTPAEMTPGNWAIIGGIGFVARVASEEN